MPPYHRTQFELGYLHRTRPVSLKEAIKVVEKITITVDGETFEAGLNDTDTAEAVTEVLPVEAEPSFWGEEIYFD
ncbi:hypothetical protein KGY71_05945, partial [Candidatus Bipolaricaulota bacterium]|nr:hypothetical protein [Candidatus Bipolaricaulota bacterium]